MSYSGFRHSHIPNALCCHIPVADSVRLLCLTQTHCHCFRNRNSREKIWKGCKMGASNTATASLTLWCYIPVDPLCDCVRGRHRHSATASLNRNSNETFSKGYEMGGSDTATCLMLSDVISMLHPLWECVWGRHWHTATASWSRNRRGKLFNRAWNEGSNTATCLLLSDVISLLHPLWDRHWHTVTASRNRNSQKEISIWYQVHGSDIATYLILSDIISILHSLWHCVWGWHWHRATTSGSRNKRANKFNRAWNGRLKHSHMSYALWWYIPVAPF